MDLDQQSKSFIQITFLIIGVLILGVFLNAYVYSFFSIKAYQILFLIFIFLFLFSIMAILMIVLFYLRIYQYRKILGNPDWFLKGLHLLYPLMDFICRIFCFSYSPLQRFFITTNNICIQSKNIKVLPEEILILTPHCLQKSTCSVKVTHDPSYCKQCGQCNVNELVQLQNKYHVSLAIATGGTLARHAIQQYHPKFILAVACERDLISGIIDVTQVPVIGILNIRPNGPCKDTKVNIDQLEYWIREISIKERLVF